MKTWDSNFFSITVFLIQCVANSKPSKSPFLEASLEVSSSEELKGKFESILLMFDGGSDQQVEAIARKASAPGSFPDPIPLLAFLQGNETIDLEEEEDEPLTKLCLVTTGQGVSSWLGERLGRDLASKRGSSTWLLEDTAENREALQEVPFDSRVFLGKAEESLRLSEIYQIGRGGPFVERSVGGGAENVLGEEEGRMWDRRRDLRGHLWRVAYTLFIPMLYLPESDGDPPRGFNYELWRLLEGSVNATSELVDAGSFGKAGSNGTWTGMVGLAQAGRVDVTLSPMHTSFERSLVLDFLNPVTDVSYALATYIRQGGTGGQFNDLFSMDNYVAALCLLVVTFVAANAIRLIGKRWRADGGEIAILVLGSCTNQGMEQERHLSQLSNRVLFLSLYLFCIIMVSAFSARLTASLVVTGATPLIETFEHVNERKLNLYIPGGGSLENGFSKAPPGTVRNQIWTRQVGTDPKFHPRLGKSFYDDFSDDDEGVVFVPTFSVQQHMAQNPSRACDLAVKEVESRIFSLGARPGFEFTSLLNHQLQKMQEGGIIPWLRIKHLEPISNTEEYICSSQKSDEPDSITLSRVYTFFLVVLGGGAIAALLFLGEKMAKRRRESTDDDAPGTTPSGLAKASPSSVGHITFRSWMDKLGETLSERRYNHK